MYDSSEEAFENYILHNVIVKRRSLGLTKRQIYLYIYTTYKRVFMADKSGARTGHLGKLGTTPRDQTLPRVNLGRNLFGLDASTRKHSASAAASFSYPFVARNL